MPKAFLVLDKMHPLYDKVYKVVMFVCKALLVIDILITFYAVLSRYISFIPPTSWSTQIVVSLMVYMAVLSATLAIRTNSHIRMTALDNRLPKSLIRVLDLLADAGVIILGYVMLVYGIRVCSQPGIFNARFDSLPSLSRVWMFIPIPLAGFTMILFEIEQVYLHIKAFFHNDLSSDAKAINQNEAREVQV